MAPTLRPTMSRVLVTGVLIGLLIGAARGALILAYVGFWGGLVWLFLVGGSLGLVYATRKGRVGAAVTLALSIAGGLTPGAIYDWHSDRLHGSELWFPLSLAFLLGLMISPMVVAGRRVESSAPVI